MAFSVDHPYFNRVKDAQKVINAAVRINAQDVIKWASDNLIGEVIQNGDVSFMLKGNKILKRYAIFTVWQITYLNGRRINQNIIIGNTCPSTSSRTYDKKPYSYIRVVACNWELRNIVVIDLNNRPSNFNSRNTESRIGYCIILKG